MSKCDRCGTDVTLQQSNAKHHREWRHYNIYCRLQELICDISPSSKYPPAAPPTSGQNQSKFPNPESYTLHHIKVGHYNSETSGTNIFCKWRQCMTTDYLNIWQTLNLPLRQGKRWRVGRDNKVPLHWKAFHCGCIIFTLGWIKLLEIWILSAPVCMSLQNLDKAIREGVKTFYLFRT